MKFQHPIDLGTLLGALKGVPYEVHGDLESQVSGLNDYRIALAGDLTWVDYAPYYPEAFATPAEVILIDSLPEKRPEGKVLVVTRDPKHAFDTIAEAFYFRQFAPRKWWERWFNPSNRHIGKRCRIHPSVSIGRDVFIGDDVTIEAHVTILDNVYIGDHTVIRANTVIGAQPFAYVQHEDKSWEQRKAWGNVIIMDHVDLLASNTIERGITGSTIIGSGTKTGCQVIISHDVWIGRNCFLCGDVAVGGYARVQNNCVFWAQSSVANSVHVAPDTTVLSSSVVHQSVKKPGLTLAGNPAVESEKYWNQRAVLNVMAKEYGAR